MRCPVIRVGHVITGLKTGGSEMMLYKLLAHTDTDEFSPFVVSMTGDGPVAGLIRDLDVPVHSLGMRRGLPNPLAVAGLINIFRRERPDVIQSWMYHADFISWPAARRAGRPPLVWGLRQSNLSPEVNKKSTLILVKILARMSGRVPFAIIANSRAAGQAHVARGYDEKKITVIPNGFDTEVFKPDPGAREKIRADLGVGDDEFVIGLVGRFDPQKDIGNFIAAAGIFGKQAPKAGFVLCGDGLNPGNAWISDRANKAGLAGRLILLGPRTDTPAVMNAFDLFSSSSKGESFANVIGEAMACALPVVVTDVGDSASIVGDAGLAVAPGDPEALARAWLQIYRADPDTRRKTGLAARQRIKENYAIKTTAEAYAEVYRRALASR